VPHADGVFPPIAVRDLVEEMGSDRLDEGLEIEIWSKRGVTSRGAYEGGDQESELSASYRMAAAKSRGAAAHLGRCCAVSPTASTERPAGSTRMPNVVAAGSTNNPRSLMARCHSDRNLLRDQTSAVNRGRCVWLVRNSPLGHSNVACLRQTTYLCQNPLDHLHVAAMRSWRWLS
jgi:hypothetical protein